MLKTLIIQQGNSDDDKHMLMIMKGKHYAFPWVGRGLKKAFLQVTGSNNVEKHFGDKKPARDP